MIKLILLAIFSSKIFAANLDSEVGTTAATFLKISPGARATAMGESFVAVADDVTSVYWNPAGLGQIKKKEITFMHNFWLAGMNYDFLAFTYPIKEHAFGLNIVYLSAGELEGRDDKDELISNFTASDLAIGLSYSRKVIDLIFPELKQEVFLGTTLKVINERIENTNPSTVALDIGAIYKRNEILSFAIALQNLGFGLKFIDRTEILPFNLKIGTSYKFQKRNLTVSTELNKPIDNRFRLNLGGEYLLKGQETGFIGNLYIRGGGKYQIGGNDDIGLFSSIMLGFGYKYSRFSLDYAFVPYGELDFSHRFSITYTW